MTIRTPSWLQAGSYPAEDDRLLIQALLGGSVNTAPSTGIVGSADLAVTASPTPDMHVHAAAGAAFVAGTETTTQGVYGFVSDAAVDVGPLAASDGTNDRISLIVAQILDAGYSGASNIGQIVEVAGVPASSPVAPPTPKNAIVLAQVRVPKLATTIIASNITDMRAWVSSPFLERGNPAGRFYNSTQDNLATGAPVQITTTTQDFAKGGCTCGVGFVTVPVAGIYSLSAMVAFSNTAGSGGPSTAGMFTAIVERNGATLRTFAEYAPAAGTQIVSVGGCDLVSLAAGDVLTLWAQQGTGGNQGVFPGAGFTWLSVSLCSS